MHSAGTSLPRYTVAQHGFQPDTMTASPWSHRWWGLYMWGILGRPLAQRGMDRRCGCPQPQKKAARARGGEQRVLGSEARAEGADDVGARQTRAAATPVSTHRWGALRGACARLQTVIGRVAAVPRVHRHTVIIDPRGPPGPCRSPSRPTRCKLNS